MQELHNEHWKLLAPSNVNVEIFPHTSALSSESFGKVVRLPGRHHSNPQFWTRVWHPDEGRWLSGGEAITAICRMPLMASDAIEAIYPFAELPLENHSIPGLEDSHRATMRGSHKSPLAGDQRRYRATAYLRKMPRHLTDGRNRAAYNFAAFLCGDLEFPVQEALVWLRRWDDLNPCRLRDEPGFVDGNQVSKLEEICESAFRNNRSRKCAN